jgi:DNA-binding MarR family transcriptional regulator
MSASLLETQLRQVFDGDVAAVYADLGMEGYRPRYTPILRVLAERGPQSIRDLAIAVAVTHSAGSQTVAQLVREGHVTLESGDDARQHITHLTPAAPALLPRIDLEWAATVAAAEELEARWGRRTRFGYFESWQHRDFDKMRSLLDDKLDFVLQRGASGPVADRDGRLGIETRTDGTAQQLWSGVNHAGHERSDQFEPCGFELGQIPCTALTYASAMAEVVTML